MIFTGSMLNKSTQLFRYSRHDSNMYFASITTYCLVLEFFLTGIKPSLLSQIIIQLWSFITATPS